MIAWPLRESVKIMPNQSITLRTIEAAKPSASGDVYTWDTGIRGFGLGSIAAAMYQIQKANFKPSNIHIVEQMATSSLWAGAVTGLLQPCSRTERDTLGRSTTGMYEAYQNVRESGKGCEIPTRAACRTLSYAAVFQRLTPQREAT